MAITKVTRTLLSTGIDDQSNATAITIDSSENVGIGTTSPARALEINSGSSPIIESVASGSNNSSLRLRGSLSASHYWDIQHVHSDNDLSFGWSGSEKVRITDAGNVGIGTSSPAYALDIQKAVSGGNQGIRFIESSDGGDSPAHFIGYRSRGTNLSSPTAIQANNAMTEFGMGAHDGSNYAVGSKIQAFANQNWTSSAHGTYIKFSTTSDNSTTVSERMRIDSSGSLMVGTTDDTPYNNSAGSSADNGFAYKADSSILSVARYTTNTASSPFLVNRTGSDGVVAEFRKDGSTFGNIGVVSGNNLNIYSASSGHSGLSFGTGIIFPTDNAGDATDDITDLGSGSYRFDNIYATNGTIQTSDRNEKQDIAELTDAETRVAVAAKGLLRKFKWKSAVKEKGDEARIHFGIIAQDLQDAFTAEGLDASDYAMWCSDTWTDEETGEEQTRLGVRYSELLAFIIAAI